ncbi:MAG: hypothetical protein IPJ65_00350 [Archangiaceae bacterium]|nr:hypothetical protein [Archangiaceae bacterium]
MKTLARLAVLATLAGLYACNDFEQAYQGCVQSGACLAGGGAAGGLAGGAAGGASGGATGGGSAGGAAGGGESCDAGSMRACGKGRCTGTQTCLGDGWTLCNGAAPQVETCRNGVDDDCDGNIDGTRVNLTETAGVPSTQVTVAPLDGGSLMVLWAEGTRVQATVVSPNNTRSPPVAPSITERLDSGTLASSLPEVASDADTVAAAWFEQRADGQNRVVLATLDPTSGLSNLFTKGATTVMAGAGLTVSELAIAVSADRLMVAVVSNGALSYSVYPVPLGAFPAELAHATTGFAAQVTHVRLAAAGGGRFWLTAELGAPSPSGYCLSLDDAGLSCTAADGIGPNVVPVSSGGPYQARLFTVRSLDGGYNDVCTATLVDAGIVTLPTELKLYQGSRTELRAVPAAAGKSLLAWEETGHGMHLLLVGAEGDAGQDQVLNTGLRPHPGHLPGHEALLYDDSGDIFLRRICL